MLPLLVLLALARAAPLPPAPDPAAVTAADDARARELFQNGALLYAEGRHEDAMVAWTEAWRLSGRPLLLFNLANAAERLARWDEAMELLSRYRAFAPAEERDTLERRIRSIERRLAELEAGTAAAGAGAPVVAPTPAPAEPATPVAAAPAPVAASTASTATTPRERAVPVLPIVLFGVAGGGAVTGTVFGLRALDARADADALCVDAGDTRRCPESAGAALARERTDALVADIAFGVGAAALAGGLVTALLPGEKPVQVGLSVGGGGGIVTLGGVLP